MPYSLDNHPSLAGLSSLLLMHNNQFSMPFFLPYGKQPALFAALFQSFSTHYEAYLKSGVKQKKAFHL